jgi:hypothetical protein
MMRTIGVVAVGIGLIGLAAALSMRKRALWLPESPFSQQMRSVANRYYYEPEWLRCN